MYTRELSPPKTSPIEDGNPVFGTWDRAFEKVDLHEISRPYGYPQPRWAKDYRIKEWQSFSAHNDEFAVETLFCNVKFYRFAQVIFYDKKAEQKYVFKKVRLGGGWQMPVSLANSSMDSHSSNFYFRIHTWLEADILRLDVNIKAMRKRPSLTVHLAFNLDNPQYTPMAVSLGFSQRRMMYAYKAFAPVRGDIVFDGRHSALRQENCSGFFCDYKGFFPYNMNMTLCTAVGFDEAGKRFGFHIGENQAREANTNNENALWVDGRLTLLPPVLITMPHGPEDIWVIQDVEGMIDLTFNPINMSKNKLKIFFSKADFFAPLGYYNGVLVDSQGEKIDIKNLFGIGKKIYLRV